MTPIHTAFLPLICLASLALISCGEQAATETATSAAATTSESTADPQAEATNETSAAPAPQQDAVAPPNIVVFLIDTQRADYLQSYGHAAATSPNLKAFADDALIFDHAYAAASSTSPSHASIFTSTYPQTHGVWNRVMLGTGEEEKAIYPSLGYKSVTLAEVLEDGGYETAGICDGGNLQINRGLAQGFTTWDSKFLGAHNRVERAQKWLAEERKAGEPFFLFLHTYQVHTPYLPEPQYVEMFADPAYQGPFRKAWQDAFNAYSNGPKVAGTIRKLQQDYYNPLLPKDGEAPPPEEDITFLKALYQAEIRQMDDAFGKFVAWMKKQGLYEDTLMIVTSDHGEEFWEHGTYGHHQVYDTTLHVPFIVRAPGGPRGERRQDPIELIDLMPTLIHLADLTPPPSMMGRVLDWETADPSAEKRDVIGETNWPERQVAYRVGQQKAMLFPDSERAAEFYDLATHPGEVKDLANEEQGKKFVAAVLGRMEIWVKYCQEWRTTYQLQPGNREQDRLSPEELADMEALGYLDNERQKTGRNRIIRPGPDAKKRPK